MSSPSLNNRKNTSVYISGIPKDTNAEEIKEYFAICGVIMDDLINGGPRIKIYVDESGNLKGDALVVFLRPESVQLAVNLLDDSPFREGINIRVQPAKFNAHYNADNEEDLKEKHVIIDKDIWKKKMELMNRKLHWGEDETEEQRRLLKTLQNEQIIIIKNMLLASKESLEEVEQDAMDECSKFGPCNVLMLEDRGLVAVKFDSRERARLCRDKMNGRFYCRRKLEAYLHDGSFKIKSKHKVKEEFGAEEKRLEKFSQWIEEEDREE